MSRRNRRYPLSVTHNPTVPVTTVKAYELIGEEGQFRLPGGRTVYTNVMWDEASARSDRPRMARLVSVQMADGWKLRQVNRWVDWDQEVEVLERYG